MTEFSPLSIMFSPLLPWPVLAALGLLALGCVAMAALCQARGWGWRAILFLLLLLVMANPAAKQEERTPLKDVVALVTDKSPSQKIGDREQQTDDALQKMQIALSALEGLEVREIHVGDGDDAQNALQSHTLSETRLFEAARSLLSDVPKERRAGVIFITDGQVHDVPHDRMTGEVTNPELGPIHGLITGDGNDKDRRLVLTEAPTYGIVGESIKVGLRIEQSGMKGMQSGSPVTLHADYGTEEEGFDVKLRAGEEATIVLPIANRGENIFTFTVDAMNDELTLANNALSVIVNGVRDRLRVLLVSGHPHNGERALRNLLKSDPAVDLVHFTILRNPNEQDLTPTNELSLISFPLNELFVRKLYDFDLIIFDNYRKNESIPDGYLNNVVEYVRGGGALLEISGGEVDNLITDLFKSPLRNVLPASPAGMMLKGPFVPRLTEEGHRHPVTAALPGENLEGQENWGKWLYHDAVDAVGHDVLMTGLQHRPLLILDRPQRGRVAQITTDQIWLWSRGYDGGGPHGELLRRLSHWLMREPELEENTLRARTEGNLVQLERRSLSSTERSVTATSPSGKDQVITMIPNERGWMTADFIADELGVYRFRDTERQTHAIIGEPNPKELADVRATTEKLAAIATLTGGNLIRLHESGAPQLRRVHHGNRTFGADWIGIPENRAYSVSGTRSISLIPAAALMILLLGLHLFAWYREGK